MDNCVNCGTEMSCLGHIEVSFKKGYGAEKPFETLELCERCAYQLLAEIYRNKEVNHA